MSMSRHVRRETPPLPISDQQKLQHARLNQQFLRKLSELNTSTNMNFHPGEATDTYENFFDKSMGELNLPRQAQMRVAGGADTAAAAPGSPASPQDYQKHVLTLKQELQESKRAERQFQDRCRQLTLALAEASPFTADGLPMAPASDGLTENVKDGHIRRLNRDIMLLKAQLSDFEKRAVIAEKERYQQISALSLRLSDAEKDKSILHQQLVERDTAIHQLQRQNSLMMAHNNRNNAASIQDTMEGQQAQILTLKESMQRLTRENQSLKESIQNGSSHHSPSSGPSSLGSGNPVASCSQELEYLHKVVDTLKATVLEQQRKLLSLRTPQNVAQRKPAFVLGSSGAQSCPVPPAGSMNHTESTIPNGNLCPREAASISTDVTTLSTAQSNGHPILTAEGGRSHNLDSRPQAGATQNDERLAMQLPIVYGKTGPQVLNNPRIGNDVNLPVDTCGEPYSPGQTGSNFRDHRAGILPERRGSAIQNPPSNTNSGMSAADSGPGVTLTGLSLYDNSPVTAQDMRDILDRKSSHLPQMALSQPNDPASQQNRMTNSNLLSPTSKSRTPAQQPQFSYEAEVDYGSVGDNFAQPHHQFLVGPPKSTQQQDKASPLSVYQTAAAMSLSSTQTNGEQDLVRRVVNQHMMGGGNMIMQPDPTLKQQQQVIYRAPNSAAHSSTGTTFTAQDTHPHLTQREKLTPITRADSAVSVDDGLVPRAHSDRTCPVCGQDWSQAPLDDFQAHVYQCFDAPGDIGGGDGTEVANIDRRCPVCNEGFEQSVPQEDFERHVHRHFGEENFEILQP